MNSVSLAPVSLPVKRMGRGLHGFRCTFEGELEPQPCQLWGCPPPVHLPFQVLRRGAHQKSHPMLPASCWIPQGRPSLWPWGQQSDPGPGAGRPLFLFCQ